MLDAVLSSGSSHLKSRRQSSEALNPANADAPAGALARRCSIAQSMMKTNLDCLPGILMGA
jgi:hypothetical protein